MPIYSNNLTLTRAEVFADGATGGGKMSATVVPPGVKNNIFPDVPKSERVSGSTKLRKLFWHLRNADATAGVDAYCYIQRQTGASDAVLMLAGTHADTAADITAGTRRYGAGTLAVAANAGDATITVTPEQTTHNVYQVGDRLVLTARNETDTTSAIDFYTITAVATSGSDLVLTLDRVLDNAMPLGANVASCLYREMMAAVLFATNVTGGGSVVAGNAITNNAGSIEANWTLTFTSATTFTATCAEYPALTFSGNTASTFAPNNAGVGQPYFTLPTTFWGAGLTTGSVVTFKTMAAAMPFWLERIVPAGASYVSGNNVLLGFHVESA